jgi:hypothetical protein
MAERRDRSVILVTGMSSTGKSTVLAALGRRGHQVIDTDDPGWIAQVEAPWGVEPMWDLDRVREVLDAHRSGWLFVAGCVANQGAVYDFDAVVLLSAPVNVILAGVLVRANPFGSRPEERAKIANDVDEFEPLLRAGADQEIRTTTSVAEVVAALERVAAGPGRRAGESRKILLRAALRGEQRTCGGTNAVPTVSAETGCLLARRLSRLSCRPYARPKPRVTFLLGRQPTFQSTPYSADREHSAAVARPRTNS